MNALVETLNKAERLVRNNSTSILTALGVTGTITTAYLAGKASFKAAWVINFEENLLEQHVEPKDAVKLVWKLYIPAAISGTLTVACILGSSKLNSKRTAAITAAYSLSERAFTEYKEKIVETIGEKEEKKVRDEIAARSIAAQPTSGLVIVGSGDVQCYESWTGRYFMSNMESLRAAQNIINEKLIAHTDATLSDFYYELGIPQTSSSGYTGWTSSKMLKLDYSTHLSPDNKPCIAFEYNYVHSF
jgi:hypothetical protein